jgi:hypothetical protein
MVLVFRATVLCLVLVLLSACAVYPARYGHYSGSIMPRNYTVIERSYYRFSPTFRSRRDFHGYGYPHHSHHFHGHHDSH